MLHRFVRVILFNRFVAFFHDLLIIPLALVVAFGFRYNFESVPSWQVVKYGCRVGPDQLTDMIK
jgi:hypothetical protein